MGRGEMPDTPAATIAVVADTLSFRGALVAAVFAPWADRIGCKIVVETPDRLSRGVRHGVEAPFVVLSIGNMSLHVPQVIQWARDIVDLYAATPCLVVSDRTEGAEIVQAARIGMQAFIPSSMSRDLAGHVMDLVSGGGTYFPHVSGFNPDPVAGLLGGTDADDPSQLTPRQVEVLEQLRLGRSNREIAVDLGISEATVKVHIGQVMRKLGVTNRTQAAVFAPDR